ncbi:MAG: uncharacterized protein PWP23_305 [Candidatus Sumerlaeota bacterium]|nr:uncharacterized protein [Candidatus Sumerlaeota bacterium]
MITATMTLDDVRQRLNLEPHPEGGWYRETFRSPLSVEHPHGGERAASTAIYFLLGAADFSALHRVRSDEVWHWYAGGPLQLHQIDDAGVASVINLGPDLTKCQVPQAVVPAGVWQGARPAPGARWVLCGCTVAPGFDFADFEMPGRAHLLGLYPGLKTLITELTRPE